ncbi:MAG: MotA/TolQ/ExbB proton channel family protein, partial [Rickettsiales bacterium]|nr:MotA/TolQ/ExbB proton channel family protein [Rickettsiales bacterium]
STFIGISASFLLIMTAIMVGDSVDISSIRIQSLGTFIDLRSILIVVIGTFMVTAACFSFREIFPVQKLILKTIFYQKEPKGDTANICLEIAYIYRTKCENILDLEKHQKLWRHNDYFRRAINLLIDNVERDEVLKIIKNDVLLMKERHLHGISIFRKSAEIAPAMGLIGTLIGLVQMLGKLDDPSSIGPAMAVALLTTFYGAILSYLVFTPLASKLERTTKYEIETAQLYIATVDSMTTKENPRKLQDHLNSMLPPKDRVVFFKDQLDNS